ncbi:MAG: DUF5916 domain-containing protein [Reichenbachiella sp.]|uniref:DUF5916 domain-containing protein n=1 Tax=Reichenbachiella sp. TaxID=2184521 RepID=UPI00326579B0
MNRIILFTIGLISPNILHAQPTDTLVIQRITGSIVVDGVIDESGWNELSPLPLVTYSPVFGKSPSEHTEIRVGYDEKYLYLSGKMYTRNAQDIQGNSMIRDLDLEGDFFNVLIDSYNDNENMLNFSTTPTGNRQDAEVINDAEGDSFYNPSWNAFWDTAVTINEDGWFSEIRIPFTTLRFDENDNGDVIMGLIIHRRISALNERLIFPAIPPQWNFARMKASKAQKILFKGLRSKRPLYVAPFVVSGVEQHELSDGNSEFSTDTQVGLDIKYSLSNNMTLDATLNTDFAQVEADITQVNLTRFSLFFPEKRQFFQERSGIFAFNTGGNTRLFYSRKIGLSDRGEPIKILGGMRVTGRVKKLDIGLMDLQTASLDTLDSENFGVLRFRNQLFNNYSFIGGMMTSRINNSGDRNISYGLDGIFRLTASDYLSVKWAHTVSDTSDEAQDVSIQDEGTAYVFWEKRALDGFGYNTEYSRIGELYNPAMGFIFRKNITSLSQGFRYGKLLESHGLLLRYTPYVSANVIYQNDSHILRDYTLSGGVNFDFLTRASVSIEYAHLYIKLVDDFNFLNRILIPIDEYSYDRVTLSYSTSPANNFRTTTDIEFGTFFNGFRRSLSFSPLWNVSKHLSLGMRFEHNYIHFSESDESIEAGIASINLTTALDIHLSMLAFVQYNSLEENLSSNIRLRYNFREGHDLFLVYNNQLTSNDMSGDVQQIASSNAVTLKYLYTIVK